jgi:aspartate/methionine/tyrosine aminotransferase
MLPLPFYFNHQMWCEMQGMRTVHLPFRPDRKGVPDPADAAARLSERTRAIVLISPNNPTGAIHPPDVVDAFARLARERGIALVIDETYRDFLPDAEPPHALFQDPAWADTLVHLYSFSKVFCLTGYRVGAVVCATRLRREIAKAMDSVAICAPHIGQLAALEGLRTLNDWRRDNQTLMRSRLSALGAAFEREGSGYQVVSAGAYFAYVQHPFAGQRSAEVAQRLASDENLLCLPGAMFGPGQERYLRFAFANVAAERMREIAQRLARDAHSQVSR